MSKARAGTLWVDVTMLVNWSGQLTGIQRVEYHLAKRFAEQGNVKFCVFDKARNQIGEFDFKHIAYKVEMLQHQQAQPSNPGEVDAASTSEPYRQLVKKMIKRVGRTIPAGRAKAYLRRRYQHMRERGASGPSLEKVQFQKGDVFLILSGDWSDDIFANLMTNLRAKTDFSVLQIVYDMLPAFYPAYFVPGMPQQFSRYMERMLALSDGVITISEATKRDIQRFQKEHKQRLTPVQVIRLGDDFVKSKAVKPNLNIKKGQFMLCLCTIEARKNHQLFYMAMREAVERGIDLPPLVLVGKRGWLIDDFLYAIENDPELSKRIIIAGAINDQELSWCLQNCMFSVFPSFYEGWGLPVAESLFYGKFCLASNSSSIPEVGGDLVEYFSPNDPMTLLDKMNFYSTHPKELQKKESRIAKSYKVTSWDDAFKQAEGFVNGFFHN